MKIVLGVLVACLSVMAIAITLGAAFDIYRYITKGAFCP